jgi:hypothetical protein
LTGTNERVVSHTELLIIQRVEKPVKWSFDKANGIIVINIPDSFQEESKRPCKYAYTFRIEI